MWWGKSSCDVGGYGGGAAAAAAARCSDLAGRCRYICVVRKSYQENDSVISTVTTKVKGFAFTNTSDMEARLWDVADYVIPPQVGIVLIPGGGTHWHPLPVLPEGLVSPQGADSFFVLTNMVITVNQSQSRCPAVSG